jgi:hypothetical protein
VFNFKWGFSFALIALVFSALLGVISGVSISHILLRSIIFAVAFFGLGVGVRAAIENVFPELLFDDDSESSEPITFDQPGSRVNITLGGLGGDYAVPEKYPTADGSQELGNIEDLISGVFRPKAQSQSQSIPTEVRSQGIDRSGEEDYNSLGTDLFSDQEGFKFQDFGQSMDMGMSMGMGSAPEPASEPVAAAPVKKPDFSPSFGDDSGDGLGGLPDLDSMAMAFSGGFGAEEPSGPQPQAQSFEPSPEPEQFNKGNKAQPLQGDFNPKELAEGIRTVLIKDKG